MFAVNLYESYFSIKTYNFNKEFKFDKDLI